MLKLVVTQHFQQKQGYIRGYRGSNQECILLPVTSFILRLQNLERCVPENPFCRTICRLVSASHCDACSLDQISGYWVAAVENSCFIPNATSSCSGAQITEHTKSHDTRCKHQEFNIHDPYLSPQLLYLYVQLWLQYIPEN